MQEEDTGRHPGQHESAPCLTIPVSPSPVTSGKLCRELSRQLPYLVIDGIELGEDNPVDEPRRLGHGVISQGLVELDLRERMDRRNAFVVLLLSKSPIKPIEAGFFPPQSLRKQSLTS